MLGTHFPPLSHRRLHLAGSPNEVPERLDFRSSVSLSLYRIGPLWAGYSMVSTGCSMGPDNGNWIVDCEGLFWVLRMDILAQLARSVWTSGCSSRDGESGYNQGERMKYNMFERVSLVLDVPPLGARVGKARRKVQSVCTEPWGGLLKQTRRWHICHTRSCCGSTSS